MRRKYIAMMLFGPLALFSFSMHSRPNPPAQQKIEAVIPVPPEIASMLHRACYNCHSNETKWPWYSRLPVVGSMIHSDVNHGRAVMNFSEWRAGNRALLPVSCSVMLSGDMPKFPYTLMHPESRLSNDDKQKFCAWVKQQSVIGRDITLRAGQSQRTTPGD